jgi:hypothetical protein
MMGNIMHLKNSMRDHWKEPTEVNSKMSWIEAENGRTLEASRITWMRLRWRATEQ